MAEYAVRAAGWLAAIGAGARAAVQRVRGGGAQPGEITPRPRPPADPATPARAPQPDAIRNAPRELVEWYAALELAARWSS